MLKRRRADRLGWTWVLRRRFALEEITSTEFNGHVTLLELAEVRAPLTVAYPNGPICTADNGYTWLQHFPEDSQFSMTSMYDADGNVVQHYIDICRRIGIDEDGIPWFDDLYLDIVVLPDGTLRHLDAEELSDALKAGVIDQADFDLAWDEVRRITHAIVAQSFPLLQLAAKHRDRLLPKLCP